MLGEELNFNAVSAVLVRFLRTVAGTRALAHCSLYLYVMLGQMGQTETCHLDIPAVGSRHTVALLVADQVLQTAFLSPLLSRAAT